MASFAVGDLVRVASRTYPGINKPGGVGRVTKVHNDDGAGSSGQTFPVTLVDVKYVLGGSERRLCLDLVQPYDPFATAPRADPTAPSRAAPSPAAPSSPKKRPREAPAAKTLDKISNTSGGGSGGGSSGGDDDDGGALALRRAWGVVRHYTRRDSWLLAKAACAEAGVRGTTLCKSSARSFQLTCLTK